MVCCLVSDKRHAVSREIVEIQNLIFDLLIPCFYMEILAISFYCSIKCFHFFRVGNKDCPPTLA